MNQSEYYKAAVPEPWTILGLDLKPFSAGHLILLHRVESSFVKGGDVTWDDLAISVFICSKTFEEACEAFDDPELNKFMADWHDQLTDNGKTKIDFDAKAKMFNDYMEAGHKSPDYVYSVDASDIGDVPPVQFVKAYLLSKTNLTEKEFLNRPWSLSMWDFLTLQAQEGQVRLCSSQTLADAQSIAANLAKLAAEGKLCPS